MVDYALLFGLGGFVTGGASLLYSRVQSVAARRQADEAKRAAEIDLARDVLERVLVAREKLAQNESMRNEYLAANPAMRTFWDQAGGYRKILDVRYII